MSFSKVPDGAFTRGVEPHGSAGVGVLSLGYMAGGMGQLSNKRKEDRLYPAARESFPCTLTPQGRSALLAAVKPSKRSLILSHHLMVCQQLWMGYDHKCNCLPACFHQKKVQLRIYRLATPRKISDYRNGSQSGDPVRKSNRDSRERNLAGV